MIKRSGLIIALAVLFGATSIAQNINGSITGRVTDPQGGVLSGASVTATDPSQQISVTTNTNEQGTFVVAGLRPGSYNLRVEATGFKRLDRNGIALNADQKLALGDLVMEVGAVTETVEVTAQTTLLQTTSAERSDTIIGKQIENLQVNGRNPLDMTKLIPGMVDNANFQVGGPGGIGSITANGNRGSANMLTINGIGNMDTGSNGSQNVTVSIDSTQEFHILTGMYQAEYGRNAGAQIAVVTKSGTSDLHGSGYWYHRHDDLNANSWINNAKGIPRSLFRYNDPGYTIGGPVYIPKLFPQKDKLFFFWSEEFQEQLAPNTVRNVQVPTALERKGDFSQSVNSSGKPVIIKNPTNGQPFTGNVIPPAQLYGPGMALLNLFPQPNVSGQVGYNYTSQFSNSQNRREDLLRMDYNVTSNVRVFGHYIYNSQPFTYPYGSFVLGINVPVVPIEYLNPGYSWASGATWILGPRTTNEFNMGVTHNSINIDETGTALTRTASGVTLPLLYPSAVQKDYIPGFNFAGTNITTAFAPNFTSVGDAPFVNYNTVINISDNLTRIMGSHTLKTGIFLERSRKNQSSFGNNNGFYNFGDTTANPFDTGFGFSNAALGVYQTMDQAQNYINGEYRYWNIEGFVQDTWKVTPRLTLDYGLRLSWYQPQYDASLQASTFVLSKWDPSQAPRLFQPAMVGGVRSAVDPVSGQVLPAYDIGLEVPNSGNPFNGIVQAGKGYSRYLQDNRGPQLGPRFGIAWDVTGRQNVVIRTGGGIYYDRFQGNRVFDMVRNPPEGLDPSLTYGLAQNINPSNIILAPPSLYAADPTGKLPTTYNYQFSIQTRLPWNLVLDTAYVGDIARHLQNNRNLNPVPYGADFLPQNQDPTLPVSTSGNSALQPNFLRLLRGYNQIALYESAATSNYNALQVNLTRRVGRIVFFGAAYTWSKALTTATTDTTYIRADNFTKAADYGPANFDRRQILAFNYVVNTPNVTSVNRFTRALLNGWQLSGVTQLSTGGPFTPTFTISGVSSQNITGNVVAGNPAPGAANYVSEGARIGYVSGCDPYTHSSDPWNRLNSACFTAPQPGSMGLESGVNWLYAPGLVNFDMALQKQFTIKERLRLQFRFDAFNVFNHANFPTLNTTLNFSGTYPNNLTVANNPYNSAGVLVNQNGFGTPSTSLITNTGTNGVQPGAPRILQTLIRIQF
ncbi:MAG TPA: TonB-dependent receptor [Bryobacteraceae bacterium]|nr:TonB-dependent receptor [Bryobacteraceae bacterium]